jgi:hypothetical protein
MSKIIEIKQAIRAALIEKHPRIFNQVADKDAEFPYVVYDLPNSFDDGVYENFVLEVDGWDAPPNADTTALELLMSDLDSVLHRAIIRIPGMALVIYRENRLTLLDDNQLIRRRKYRYQIRTFGGG